MKLKENLAISNFPIFTSWFPFPKWMKETTMLRLEQEKIRKRIWFPIRSSNFWLPWPTLSRWFRPPCFATLPTSSTRSARMQHWRFFFSLFSNYDFLFLSIFYGCSNLVKFEGVGEFKGFCVIIIGWGDSEAACWCWGSW